jgi:hypothetical protein
MKQMENKILKVKNKFWFKHNDDTKIGKEKDEKEGGVFVTSQEELSKKAWEHLNKRK